MGITRIKPCCFIKLMNNSNEYWFIMSNFQISKLQFFWIEMYSDY